MSDLSWIIPYQTAKDFAGPAATVIASIAAAYITWTLASRQAAIAEQQAAIARQQAETALDQLRHNLFEKRYAIYVSAQNLARMLLNRAHEVEISPSEIASYYVSIDEARFFFPDYICRWLDDLKAEAVSVHGLRSASELHSAKLQLVRRVQDMPGVFATELQFPQLTRRPRDT